MKTGILWDLDGTLLDTLADLTDSVNYALGQFGCPPRTREQVRTFVGNGAGVLIRLSLPGREDDPSAEAVLGVFQQHYAAHCRVKTMPYPGILDALSALGEKYPMAIVSNKPDYAVKALCAEYFPGTYARGESPDCPRKPAPDMLFKAMADLGVERCIYVGDSEVDILTAKNAHVPCLSVLWGFREEADLRKAGGTAFCSHPHELKETIETLLR